MSASEAVLITVSGVCPKMVRLDCEGRIGATLISLTATVKVLLALKTGRPLSDTTTITVKLEPPVVSPGIQVITPSVVIVMPGGELIPKLNTSAFVFGSVAEFVMVSVCPSLIATFALVASTGG